MEVYLWSANEAFLCLVSKQSSHRHFSFVHSVHLKQAGASSHISHSGAEIAVAAVLRDDGTGGIVVLSPILIAIWGEDVVGGEGAANPETACVTTPASDPSVPVPDPAERPLPTFQIRSTRINS